MILKPTVVFEDASLGVEQLEQIDARANPQKPEPHGTAEDKTRNRNAHMIADDEPRKSSPKTLAETFAAPSLTLEQALRSRLGKRLLRTQLPTLGITDQVQRRWKN